MSKGCEDKSVEVQGFQVEFPSRGRQSLDQDEEWCIVREGDSERRVRFHNYEEVFQTPGLYEYLFYEKLECDSPSVVCSLLECAIRDSDQESSDLTVLDLGAGNGMVGAELRRRGVENVVGIDIIPEARDAALRDRPDAYDDYLVVDLTEPDEAVRERLETHDFNCLTSVAALGFGDIPPRAFSEAYNIVQPSGWLAFNIRDRFLSDGDASGFSRLIGDLVEEGRLELVSSERYPHRLSVDGEPLYYTALVARKHGDVPADWIEGTRFEVDVAGV